MRVWIDIVDRDCVCEGVCGGWIGMDCVRWCACLDGLCKGVCVCGWIGMDEGACVFGWIV